MKLFDGIIFDVDGTLTSTNELIFSSFNFITEKYIGKTYTPDEIIALFGPTEDVILAELCGDRYDEARNDYYTFYEENHHMADSYPGIKEIVSYIKSQNIPLGIFTGKGFDAARITLQKLELIDYFDLIITGDDVNEHKPSPEGILKFINKFNLDKEKVLLIGDAPADIIAARSAGIKVASVLWDSYAKEKVMQMDSDYFFESVNELYLFVKQSLNS